MLSLQPIDPNWTSQVQALCYVVSQWDRDQWQQYLQAFPDVAASVQAGRNQIKGWELFAEEVFHRLITVPQALPYAQLRPEVLWAHRLHQLLDESVDFGEMQMACRNNKLAAGDATHRLINLALNALPTPPKSFNPQTAEDWEAEFVRLQAQLTALEETQQQLIQTQQGETDPQRRTDLQQQLDQVDFDIAELKPEIKKLKAKLGRAARTAQAYAETIGLQMAQAMAAAVQEALNGVRQQQQLMSAFGWGEGLGMLNHPGNSKEKEQVAQRLTRDARFRKIAEAAGRFQAIAALRQGAKRSKHIPDQIADTSLGSNLAKLVPSELVRVALVAVRTHFLKDFADESLQQQEFNGSTDDGQQGPVVICLDKSGSMDGQREIDSTGLMLALLSIAQEQQRNARVILFDGMVRHIKDIDPFTVTHTDRIDLADRRYSGGTDFMQPLQKALEALEQNAALRKADVIFITDGEADVTESFSERWREAQVRLSFKVYTLLVGTYVNPDVLNRFSDQTIHVQTLNDPKVHQVFDI